MSVFRSPPRFYLFQCACFILLAMADRPSVGAIQDGFTLRPVFPDYPETPLRGASITIKDGITTVKEKELPPDPEKKLPAATPEQIRQGEAILRETAKFLGSKKSISFQVQKHNDEEGTMGFVGGDHRVALEFARPNRLAFTWDRIHDPSYFVEVISDGDWIIRRDYGRCCVSEAPESLADLLVSKSLKPSDAWRFDAPRILSLFDPSTVESLIESCDVSFRGTRDFGPLKTNQLILDGGGPTPNDWRSFRWKLYIARGEQPVPVYLEPDLDGLFPSLAGKDRWSASDIRFTEWSFAESEEEDFRVEVKDGEELVDSRQALGLGEPQTLNPMVGQPLPQFSAINDAGETIKRNELVGNGPLVLILWGAENAAIGAWWKKFNAVRTIYEPKGVRFETLHIGDESNLESGLKKWKANPPVLKLKSNSQVFAKGSLAFDWDLKKKPVEPGKTIQAYV
ncbi:MAG: hypothetical protein AAGA30_06545, partial [Planctomycetota bacterium]